MSCIAKVLRVQPPRGYRAPQRIPSLPSPPTGSKDMGLKKALECAVSVSPPVWLEEEIGGWWC